MSTITALQAKLRFGELLERVSRGEEVVITKHSKPVARIIPEGRPALEQIREAVDGLRALRNQMAARKGFKPLTDKEIRDAVSRGRP